MVVFNQRKRWFWAGVDPHPLGAKLREASVGYNRNQSIAGDPPADPRALK